MGLILKYFKTYTFIENIKKINYQIDADHVTQNNCIFKASGINDIDTTKF